MPKLVEYYGRSARRRWRLPALGATRNARPRRRRRSASTDAGSLSAAATATDRGDGGVAADHHHQPDEVGDRNHADHARRTTFGVSELPVGQLGFVFCGTDDEPLDK